MFERIGRLPAGAWITFGGVIVLGTILLALAVTFSGVYQTAYHDHAANARKAAIERQFEQQCAEIQIPDELRRCFEAVIETGHDTQRAQEDLQAQKRMADYTLLLLWVTACIGLPSLALTAAGVYLVAETITATRELAIAEKRAWLNVDEIYLASDPQVTERGFEFPLIVSARNDGTTPARHVHIAAHPVAFNGHPDRFQKDTDSVRYNFIKFFHMASMSVVFPKETTASECIDIVVKHDALEERIAESVIEGGGLYLMIFVNITYRIIDDDSAPHQTGIPYVLGKITPDKVLDTSSLFLERADFVSGWAT